MNILTKALSYLMPINLKSYNSGVSGKLEINLTNGKMVLDTISTNYSYGSLQRILSRGLTEIKFDKSLNNILVLGLGGGSIVQTIREEFGSNAFLELVEIDPEIISIATEDFGIGMHDNIRIVHADALQFVRDCQRHYDLIIVDIFIVDTIPEQFTKRPFLVNLFNRLGYNGGIVFNTLNRTMTENGLVEIQAVLESLGSAVRVIRNVESTNTLILAERNEKA